MHQGMNPVRNPLQPPCLDPPTTEGQNTMYIERDDNFHVAHLSLVPSELLQTLRCLTWTEKAALEEIITSTADEKRIYVPLAELLTSLSKRIYSKPLLS